MAKPHRQEHSTISNLWEEGLTVWNWPLMASAGGVVQACAEACAEWQQEVMRFAGARFEEDRRAQAALASSRSIAAIAKVQQEWGTKAASDYLNEAARLAQIAAKFAQAGMAPYQIAESGLKESVHRHAAE